jgi:hypothetical protein
MGAVPCHKILQSARMPQPQPEGAALNTCPRDSSMRPPAHRRSWATRGAERPPVGSDIDHVTAHVARVCAPGPPVRPPKCAIMAPLFPRQPRPATGGRASFQRSIFCGASAAAAPAALTAATARRGPWQHQRPQPRRAHTWRPPNARPDTSSDRPGKKPQPCLSHRQRIFHDPIADPSSRQEKGNRNTRKKGKRGREFRATFSLVSARSRPTAAHAQL